MGYMDKKQLDFDYTCPIIDNAISAIDADIGHIFDQLAPDDLDASLIERVMDCVSYGIEKVRETNIKMREAADYQINEQYNDLTERIEELEAEIEDLKSKNAEMEDTINSNVNQIESLEDRIEDQGNEIENLQETIRNPSE